MIDSVWIQVPPGSPVPRWIHTARLQARPRPSARSFLLTLSYTFVPAFLWQDSQVKDVADVCIERSNFQRSPSTVLKAASSSTLPRSCPVSFHLSDEVVSWSAHQLVPSSLVTIRAAQIQPSQQISACPPRFPRPLSRPASSHPAVGFPVKPASDSSTRPSRAATPTLRAIA